MAAAPAAPAAPVTEGSLGKKCKCGIRTKCLVSKSEKNPGRLFWSCANATEKRCKGFIGWADEESSGGRGSSGSSNKFAAVSPMLRIYTDGACKGNQNVHLKKCPAGFGVVVYLHAGGEAIEELYGPVDLDPASPFYMHAEVGSNNTAELSALGECFYWIRDFGTMDNFPGPIRVLYDSEYAYKTISGQFNGEKNVALYKHIRAVYRQCQAQRPDSLLQFEHVKGHSGDEGNDRADLVANKGSRGERCTSGRFATAERAVGKKRPSSDGGNREQDTQRQRVPEVIVLD